jgi:hypothetical protein
LFNLVASVRGDHWAKNPDECLVFARPTSQYLEHVSPKLAKQIGDIFLPISMLVGLGIMLAEPIKVERSLAVDQTNRQHSSNGVIRQVAEAGGRHTTQATANASDQDSAGGVARNGHSPSPILDTDTL